MLMLEMDILHLYISHMCLNPVLHGLGAVDNF